MNTIRFQLVVVLSCFVLIPSRAQLPDVTPLFQEEKPLAIRLSFSFKEIKKSKNDTIYFPAVLYYKNDQNDWDSVNVSLRARGDFRRKNCYFPPLRIKLKKTDTKKTPFEGNRSLKLVLPCQTASSYNKLLIKEYICYQLYEPTTPYSFNTRLVDLTLSDQGGKQTKTYQVSGFFIEDDNLVAKRFHGKVIDSLDLHPLMLQDTSSIKHDLFQYMIANTDWSTTFRHNAKVILVNPKKYIPVPYDFDMSGFVNAPYATVNETLAISSVQERTFRGFCRNKDVTQFVRRVYVNVKPSIINVLSRYEDYFNTKELAGMKKYLEEFYSVLANDVRFDKEILQKCRTK